VLIAERLERFAAMEWMGRRLHHPVDRYGAIAANEFGDAP
jgi:hypothetical protein